MGAFAICFLTPALSAVVYYTFLASDQFVSEARFSTSSSEGNGLEILAGLSSLFKTGQTTDAAIVAEYIESRSILLELEKKFDLQKVFSPGSLDLVAELQTSATAEELLSYWRKQIGIKVDRSSGLLTLEVRTFSPADSLALANEIIAISERMVNRLTRRNDEKSLMEAEDELQLAKAKLESAVSAMRDARDAAGVLDVDLTAKGYSDILTALNMELAKIRTQINTLEQNNASEAPQLIALKSRAESLRQQIGSYENRFAGMTKSESPEQRQNLADSAAILAEKDVERKIAQSEYEHAVAAYESARLNRERQRSYLMTYVTPRAAEEPLYPRRLLAVSLVVFGSFLLWAVIAGLGLLVRDHTAA
ncbi:hypothetical protein B0E45_29780 [Sinorhizobium sp. A49]|uniref:hypothetical protein n=1 Tax=Sinorhizobium sp. A49 TaxID=1945861 RepID=UPI0009CD1DE8|nr:hypothetical protein [Sinorhizobium sp. A49]OOG63087.1 hypothetical protein B0E45_29780 [Sinorhizobium sp. A49]